MSSSFAQIYSDDDDDDYGRGDIELQRRGNRETPSANGVKPTKETVEHHAKVRAAVGNHKVSSPQELSKLAPHANNLGKAVATNLNRSTDRSSHEKEYSTLYKFVELLKDHSQYTRKKILLMSAFLAFFVFVNFLVPLITGGVFFIAPQIISVVGVANMLSISVSASSHITASTYGNLFGASIVAFILDIIALFFSSALLFKCGKAGSASITSLGQNLPCNDINNGVVLASSLMMGFILLIIMYIGYIARIYKTHGVHCDKVVDASASTLDTDMLRAVNERAKKAA